LYSFECIVSRIEKLRIPNVYRVHSVCGDVELTIEMHKELMRINENDKLKVDIVLDKEKCLQHEFCGRGHVVSTSLIEDKYRVVISIGGLLVVLKKLSEEPRLEPVQELFVGLTILK